MSITETFLQPLYVPAAYEHVVDRLRRSIWLGQVLPGERLPPERVLAESLGVSRVTVREALRVLQGEGLISTSRGNGGGTFVNDPEFTREERGLRLLRSKVQLGHVHELRLAIEPMAASLAASHITVEDVTLLENTQVALFASTGVDTFRRADSAFHLGIAAASGNPYLAQAVEDARSKLFLVLDVADFDVHQETSGRAHAEILSAIVGNDAPNAAALMKAHLEDAWSEIVTIIETFDARLKA